MGTEVALFDDKGLPAHLADLNAEGNIVVRESIPQLSFRGKVWRVVTGGDENIVYKTVNGQPTDEPAQVIAGVLLDYNKARSRAYFEGAYEEGKTAQPTCWSHDGVKAHSTVPADKCPSANRSCAECPMSQKGSKITDAGKEVTACSQFKRAAFVPIQNTKHPALLLKLPQTSIWDKDAEEFAAKNFYAFDQYLDLLKRRGVNHTASVVTKIKFDPRTSYPKLLFGPLDWLPAEVYADIQAHLADKDNIAKILNSDPSANETGTATAEGEAAAPAAAVAAAAPAAAKPAAAPKAAAKPAAAPKAAAKPAAAPPPKSSDDDDGELMGRATTAAPAAAAKPAAPAAAKPPAEPAQVIEPGDAKSSGINDLLAEWEGDQ